MILAGDVGGTKTNLCLFEDGMAGKSASPSKVVTFLNADFGSLEELIGSYLERSPDRIDNAVFAVAGPVIDRQAKVTNLQWLLSEDHLSHATGISRVQLMNDLEATAYAVPYLPPGERCTLNEGVVVEGGNIAVIAPGTGLGESFLTWDGSRYRAHATEGSHVDFAPTNALEVKLLNYLLSFYDHVSYERVCSGIGIPNVYAFLKNEHHCEEPAWLRDRLAQETDPAAVIINAALDSGNPCEICRTTLELFVSILGMEAGNLALKVMARGGVYLGGGIPPRIVEHLRSGPFLTRFRAKGRMTEIMRDIPVHVILNPQIAVFGAARYGMNL